MLYQYSFLSTIVNDDIIHYLFRMQRGLLTQFVFTLAYYLLLGFGRVLGTRPLLVKRQVDLCHVVGDCKCLFQLRVMPA